MKTPQSATAITTRATPPSGACASGACPSRSSWTLLGRHPTSHAEPAPATPHEDAGSEWGAEVGIGIGVVGKVVGLSPLGLKASLLRFTTELCLGLEAADEKVANGIAERPLPDHLERAADLLCDARVDVERTERRQLLLGLERVPILEIGQAQVEAHVRFVGADLEGLLERVGRLVDLALLVLGNAQTHQRVGSAGVGGEGLAEVTLGLGEAPLVQGRLALAIGRHAAGRESDDCQCDQRLFHCAAPRQSRGKAG